jgi:hypothetical protein
MLAIPDRRKNDDKETSNLILGSAVVCGHPRFLAGFRKLKFEDAFLDFSVYCGRGNFEETGSLRDGA